RGKARRRKPLLLTGDALREERRKAETLPRVPMTSRDTSDLIMLGIGAFTPLEGFMGHDDWKGVCDGYRMADGVFWPIPITLSVAKEQADGLKVGREVALVDEETGELMGSLTLREKYAIDRTHECKQVFRTTDPAPPGVANVMGQREVNVAGPVKVFSEGRYPADYPGLFMRPAQTRKIFEEKGGGTVAAVQLRNPMHRPSESLEKL